MAYKIIFFKFLIILLSNVNTEPVRNTESMTHGGKAYTGFSNTLEPRALHDVCTPVYTQDAAHFWINQNRKQLLKAVLFRSISSQRACCQRGTNR